MGKIGLIIKREYTTRVKKKSFILMTILGPILAVGFIAGAIWFGTQGNGPKKIAIVDESGVLNTNDLTYSPDDHKYDLVNGDANLAGDLVVNGQYDYAVWIPKEIMKGNKFILYYKEFPSGSLYSDLQNKSNIFLQLIKLEVKRSKKEVDISNEQFRSITQKVNLGKANVDENAGDERKDQLAAVGLIFGILIYLFIFMYGVQVMKGVIEEKSNRIVEVIVSSVKPFQLMMGKIIGIMLVGLTQFIIWIFLSTSMLIVVNATVLPNMMDPSNQAAIEDQQTAIGVTPDISPMDPLLADENSDTSIQSLIFEEINWPAMIGLFIFYFIGGYLLYGALMAAIGSAVDSETDTQQFMLPITMPLIFAYIIGILTVENPNSSAAFWCSEIPFTSPIVMLVRFPMQEAGIGWQLALSMFLLIITFIGTTYIAGRIYRTGILMYGKKVTYRELFKWMRYK